MINDLLFSFIWILFSVFFFLIIKIIKTDNNNNNSQSHNLLHHKNVHEFKSTFTACQTIMHTGTYICTQIWEGNAWECIWWTSWIYVPYEFYFPFIIDIYSNEMKCKTFLYTHHTLLIRKGFPFVVFYFTVEVCTQRHCNFLLSS